MKFKKSFNLWISGQDGSFLSAVSSSKATQVIWGTSRIAQRFKCFLILKRTWIKDQIHFLSNGPEEISKCFSKPSQIKSPDEFHI